MLAGCLVSPRPNAGSDCATWLLRARPRALGGSHMIASVRCAALVLGLALLATCSAASAAGAAPCTSATAGGEWPSYGHDVANTRTQPEPSGFGPSAVAQIKPSWVFSTSSTGDGTGFNTTPVTYGGCVFIGSFGGVAYALERKTGRLCRQRHAPS